MQETSTLTTSITITCEVLRAEQGLDTSPIAQEFLKALVAPDNEKSINATFPDSKESIVKALNGKKKRHIANINLNSETIGTKKIRAHATFGEQVATQFPSFLITLNDTVTIDDLATIFSGREITAQDAQIDLLEAGTLKLTIAKLKHQEKQEAIADVVDELDEEVKDDNTLLIQNTVINASIAPVYLDEFEISSTGERTKPQKVLPETVENEATHTQFPTLLEKLNRYINAAKNILGEDHNHTNLTQLMTIRDELAEFIYQFGAKDWEWKFHTYNKIALWTHNTAYDPTKQKNTPVPGNIITLQSSITNHILDKQAADKDAALKELTGTESATPPAEPATTSVAADPTPAPIAAEPLATLSPTPAPVPVEQKKTTQPNATEQLDAPKPDKPTQQKATQQPTTPTVESEPKPSKQDTLKHHTKAAKPVESEQLNPPQEPKKNLPPSDDKNNSTQKPPRDKTLLKQFQPYETFSLLMINQQHYPNSVDQLDEPLAILLSEARQIDKFDISQMPRLKLITEMTAALSPENVAQLHQLLPSTAGFVNLQATPLLLSIQASLLQHQKSFEILSNDKHTSATDKKSFYTLHSELNDLFRESKLLDLSSDHSKNTKTHVMQALYNLPKTLESAQQLIGKVKANPQNHKAKTIVKNVLFWLAMTLTGVGLIAYGAYQLHHRKTTGNWHFFPSPTKAARAHNNALKDLKSWTDPEPLTPKVGG